MCQIMGHEEIGTGNYNSAETDPINHTDNDQKKCYL